MTCGRQNRNRRKQINWYKHDTDATQDAKVRKLLIKYGATGYAIYFHCLELIAAEISETNLTFELEHDSEIIADNLYIKGTAEKSGIEIVEEIMKYIISLGLFQESGGKVFCFKLLKRLDSSMTSNSRFRELIVTAKETHDYSIQNHDAIMIPSCKPSSLQASKQYTRKKQHIHKIFSPPTVDEVKEYCNERGNSIKAEHFIDYYATRGWMLGKVKMKDWRAAVRTWERNEKTDVRKPVKEATNALADTNINGR